MIARTPWDDRVEDLLAEAVASARAAEPESHPRFRRALARYAVAPEAPFRVGQRLLRQAAADLTAMLVRFHDCAAALELRGMVRNKLRQFEDALADFDRALALSPGDLLALDGRAEAHAGLVGVGIADLSHASLAAADLEELSRALPEDHEPHVKLGRLKYAVATLALNADAVTRRRHLREAAAHFETALRLDPDCEVSRRHVIRTLAAMIDGLDGAEVDLLAHRLHGHFSQMARLELDDGNLHEIFGHAMARAGRFDEALASLRIALEGLWEHRAFRRAIEAAIRDVQEKRRASEAAL